MLNFAHLHVHNEYSLLDGFGTAENYAKRAKEIGLRKVIGASKPLIRRQIYSELFIIVTISFILAIILSIAFLRRTPSLSACTEIRAWMHI